MRWTKREIDQFRRAWLLERMAHTWSEDGPTRCTRCAAKFSRTAVKRCCPKRRKPNRWRLHYRRALLKAQYPPNPPVVRNAAWIVAQLHEIRRAVHRDPAFEDLRFWKYHRLARRYRRLLRDWWQLPAREVAPFIMRAGGTAPDTYGAQVTRKRTQLLQRAAVSQQRTIRDGGCTYTIAADARVHGGLIFTE